ncbi:hypothetical protein BPC006_II1552 [Burkholderia pseudomallei BPC006]|nr:hypothetical protein BPC006_II1552 [Burkholderia pseudomallei BPC006]
MRTRKRVGLSRARCNGRVRGGEARGGPDGGGIDRPGPRRTDRGRAPAARGARLGARRRSVEGFG